MSITKPSEAMFDLCNYCTVREVLTLKIYMTNHTGPVKYKSLTVVYNELYN